MLKGGGGRGGDGSYLPLDGKGCGSGGWNGLKPDGPNPKSCPGSGPGPGGGLESINGGETDLIGYGSLMQPPAALLLLLLLLLL